ncbi:MAG: alpha/beta hydrolase [Thermoplasmata archaeon]|nr:alpha/beta hydrolase [Thermoplasmata archaeon]
MPSSSHDRREEEGSGSPVVLLHGYPLDSRMWGADVPVHLPGHRLVFVDLPGFGHEKSRPSPDTLSGFSDAVARSLQERRIGPATIVGHSMGGYVALQLYRDHPELFSRLILTDTRSHPDTPEARASRLETSARLARPGETLDVEATVRGLLAPTTWESAPGVVDQVRAIVADAQPERLVPTLKALAGRPDLGPVLSTIKVPTLVLWGAADRLIPPAQSQEMVPQVPGAIGREIPGAAHLPSLEAPHLFYPTIARFLSGPDAV